MIGLRTLIAAACVSVAFGAQAQVSFHTAVDLALRSSPRVKMAEAEVERARASLEQSRDVYIPALNAGSGLGYTYGFPVGTPTLYNFTVQSLAFDMSQKNYIRAARLGLEAANLSLRDIRLQVAGDAANTYIALDNDLQRMRALTEESGASQRLVRIVQERLDAGQDTRMELTRSKLTDANIRLRRAHVESDLIFQRAHLSHLTGLPEDTITTETSSIPVMPTVQAYNRATPDDPPTVKAAYANADSKLQMAFGDARKMYRPQVYFAAQYNRFAAFNGYDQYYKNYKPDNFSVGIQMSIPIFNFAARAKARETYADATRSRHEADYARDQFLDGRIHAVTAANELQLRTEVASLDRELAADQLDVVRTQLTSGNPGGTPVTPKEEQTAVVQERGKFLDFLETDLQLRQAQIDLMRVNGQLEDWLKASVTAAPAPR